MAGKGKRGPSSQMSKWEEKENLILIQGWKRKGLSDEEVAKNIGITVRTLYKWAEKSVHIKQALKCGKERANFIVENKLFERAVSGNTTAIIFWLKNNYRDKYSDTPLTDDEVNLIRQNKRKAKAEADIAEAKARMLNEGSEKVAEKVDKLFNELINGLEDESSDNA